MDTLARIMSGMELGREEYRRLGASAAGEAGDIRPELVLGDNAEYMRDLICSGYAGKFRLIYADPPFFTRSKFNAAVTFRGPDGTSRRVRHLAFDDRFERSLEYYIASMTCRLLLMKDLLADDGTMWIHLDWHSSHYVRIVLDELMGEKNFVNEIVWCYKSGGSGKRHFSRKHDSILVYGKTAKYHISIPQERSYNRGFKPYNFKGVREYQDENGWYTLVNMKDVWSIDMVGRTSAERTGYATQKPLELMRRIVQAGSEEGDLVGDFFCGSGSFLEAAQTAGRIWKGCDNEMLAVSSTCKRLFRAGADFDFSSNAESNAGYGRFDVSIRDEQPLEGGDTLVKCAVTGFEPQIDTGYIQMNDRRYIEEVLDSDPMALLDYVIVHTGLPGRASRAVFESGFDDMSFVCRGRARITAVDRFGRTYPAEIRSWTEDQYDG